MFREIMVLHCIFIFVPRFDLIFLMLDPQDEMYDRRLASHLVSLYFHGADEEAEANLVSPSHWLKWICVNLFTSEWQQLSFAWEH